MRPGPLRILTTNDFIGSFFPQRTSYGHLPGAANLATTVQELRAEHAASLWIDVGDLLQGSPLGPLTDGAWGFLAARALDIDASVVGNHELDWGLAHLRRFSRELPFPLLAANADLGFAGSTLLRADAHDVGIVGITYPQLAYLHPDHKTRPDVPAVVADHANRLRRAGASIVVLALHDGVDLGLGGEGAAPVETGRLEQFCFSLERSVNLVLGGHSLGAFHGSLGGIPYLQPWPFGSQVGIADFDDDGGVTLDAVDVTGSAPFEGPGAAVYTELDAQVVGVNPTPLASTPGRDTGLIQAIADGLLVCDDTVDLAIVGPRDLWNQAPHDGTYAFLPAGPVSMAQILRLTPACGARSAWGGQLVNAEVSRADADRIVESFMSASYAPEADFGAGDPAVARRSPAAPRQRVAVPPFYASRIDEALGRSCAWSPTTTSWRDALLALPWMDPEAVGDRLPK